MTFSPGLFAFGFDLRNNLSRPGEGLSVFGSSGLLGTVSVEALPDGGSQFVGVTSDTEIVSVTFDEDSLGDDIAIGGISMSTAVPEPSSLGLMGLGLIGLAWRRREGGRYSVRHPVA